MILAVAGGRKTQSIVEDCRSCPEGRRILVLGYTTASQHELLTRIRAAGVHGHQVEVMGWFAFLLQHLVRPYLPLLYEGRRLTGLNFEGDPGRYATGIERFLDTDDRAYMLHLAKLAHDVAAASNGAAIDRLEHIYDEIYIDEVQDLGGWDLEIIQLLLKTKLRITMVGDMRQALLSTNIKDPKNKPYRKEKIFNWFQLMEQRKLLSIEQAPTTYRSSQPIATLSDSIFDPSLGYAPTISASTETHEHAGLFTVREADAIEYAQRHEALCLRHSRAVAKHLDLPFMTFGVAKGRTVDHVLIYPTAKALQFLTGGARLEGQAACALYVGVTRAKHSVAFITDQQLLNTTAWTRAPILPKAPGPS
ncbi:UvrD-helicase domain-containing protein [Nocardioides currus]|uniref:UvrD-helicase domain-containing protein n=1 Tax=Nocardioides currus TaxID=2133958 RepID=UPI0014037BBB|nr:UvrD-helicase domain-containing protein [Nocardioides currus]